nr:hypothetical protein [Lachnospiraceae bacterium]
MRRKTDMIMRNLYTDIFKKNRIKHILVLAMILCMLCGCGDKSVDRSVEIPADDQVSADIAAPGESNETPEDTTDNTMLNVTASNAVSYSEIPAGSENDEEEPVEVEDEKDKILRTEDGKMIVDLVMFMGQSNMSGTGGNVSYAPKVPEGHGFEFRAISDPTRLYPIEEPFGINENAAISDTAIGKRGSMVSAFANKYYELTGVPIVAVSASAGGRDTAFFMKDDVMADFSERQKRAQVWLESNDYFIRKQYVIWLQGESDAEDGLTGEQYNQNMDNIIRPLFIGGLQKVFIVTPGRTLTGKYFFDNVVYAQINMCRTS